jgi:hypothetical protein
MQGMLLRGRSLGTIAIVVLLMIQCVLGLFFSIPLLVELLAPGRPVIVSGASIITGPLAGAALAVALASPIIAWGLWMLKHWAPQRTLLLEILSLGVWVLEFTQPGIDRRLLLTGMGIAVLILICWYADPAVRAVSHARQSNIRDEREQA